MIKRFFVIAGILAFVSGFIFGEESIRNSQITKGIEYHNLSRADSGKNASANIEKALITLEPFVSSDGIACAYYGSALTIKAGIISEKNPIKSLSYLEEGSSYLDKAVNLKPDDIELRMIRLENGIEVSQSSPVKRYSVIKEDVDFLLLEKNMCQLSSKDQAEAYLYCGYYFQDAGDLETALDLFDLAVETNGECEAGLTAQKMLDKYSE